MPRLLETIDSSREAGVKGGRGFKVRQKKQCACPDYHIMYSASDKSKVGILSVFEEVLDGIANAFQQHCLFTAPCPSLVVIAPALIDELAATAPMESLANVPNPGSISGEAHRFPAPLDEQSFLEFLEADLCGTDVLRASVGGFERDTEALESCISQALQL